MSLVLDALIVDVTGLGTTLLFMMMGLLTVLAATIIVSLSAFVQTFLLRRK